MILLIEFFVLDLYAYNVEENVILARLAKCVVLYDLKFRHLNSPKQDCSQYRYTGARRSVSLRPLPCVHVVSVQRATLARTY